MQENDGVAIDKAEYKGRENLPDDHIAKSSEDLVIFGESKRHSSSLTKLKIEALLESCDGRPELEEIVYAIVEDKCLPEPKALAEYFDRPVDEIYQQLRALRRRSEKIIKDKEWTKNGQE